MSPTIKDVAKKANVSIATVSRILNGLPGYKVSTKDRVMKAIEELGYQPNAVARGLINKKTQTIGILFPDVSSSFSSEVLKGIEAETHDEGHSVIVCNTASNGVRTLKYLQVLHEKRVDGIIFTSEYMKTPYYELIKKMKIPVVLLSSFSYQYPIPYVKVDDKHAAYSGAEYLIRKGHKNIGMIGGPEEDPIAGAPRVEGFVQALEVAGYTDARERVMVTKGFGFKDGKNGLPKLLKQVPNLTAVFAASDEIAMGVMSSAYEMGINVPDDLSVIGYDNLPISEMYTPPLTTVGQPLYEMGQSAAQMLLSMITTGRNVNNKIMRHQIIERKTVR